MGETGVDEHASILLGYPGGQLASLTCSARVHTQREATIVGTCGQIRIHEPIICAGSLTLRRYSDQDRFYELSGETRYAVLGGHSFNIANEAVLSGNFVSGAED